MLGSVATHLVVIVILVLYGRLFPPPKAPPPRRPGEHVTLIYPLPAELTQKEPNRGPRSKMFLGEAEPVKPLKLFTPKSIPSAPPPPPPSKGDLSREEKPPQIVPNPEPTLSTTLAPLIQQPPPPAPPKLALENVDKGPAGKQGPLQPGLLAQQHPGNVIDGAVRDLSRNAARGGAAVGDGFGGGAVDGFTLPSPGNSGSNLELLSDPKGVDFRPYLARILASVRRNWYAVLPESARLGMVRGRVAIQFIIVRNGNVSKLVIADASGYETLDRAAVAGISASNPFPPLPPEFRGNEVRLQFTFLYNIAVKR